MTKQTLRIATSIAALAIASTTFASAATIVRGPALPAAHRAGHGWMSADAKKMPLVYASDAENSVINVYPNNGTQNPAPVGQITSGLNSPQSLAVDAAGNLYVANLAGNNVTEYAPGSVIPSYTYTNSVNQPSDVAVDAAGNVYVTMYPGYLLAFPQKSQNAAVLINDVGQGTTFYGVTVGKTGIVYISANFGASGPGGVIEYANGVQGGLGINLGYAAGITTDKKGNILPIDKFVPGVDVFQPGFVMPSRKLAISNSNPWYPRFDKAGKHLFVSDQFEGEVHELDYATGAQTNTFGASFPFQNKQITGVAVSPPAKW